MSLFAYIVFAAALFSLGIAGIILNRKNLIVLLMSMELILLAVNTNLIAFAHGMQSIAGQIFVFFILTVAAAEAAIGLAIIVVLFRVKRNIIIDDLNELKG
jgi:NADH-quinone oxidoreductase subunit K